MKTVVEAKDYLESGLKPPHTFAGFVCEQCGEMTVSQYGRTGQNGKKICQDCAGY